MFNYVESILNFGFLGLAFLMLYLAYSLIKKSAESESDIKKNESELIRKFMNIAIVFMVLSGPLQWATIYVKDLNKKVSVNIALNRTTWDNSFGKIYIRDKGKYEPLGFKAIKKEFSDNGEILLNIQDIVDSIQKMRRQIEILNNRANSNNTDERNTIEGG